MTSDMKNDLIKAWDVSFEGRCIPLTYDQATERLAAICPEETGAVLLKKMMTDDWVRITVYGVYELSPSALKIRQKMGGNEVTKAVIPVKACVTKDVEPWKKFKRILSYYIECVHHQERSQEYLFAADEGRTFFVPSLPTRWLRALGEEQPIINIPLSKHDQVAARTLICRSEFDEDIYIGYPLTAVHHNGKLFYSPIALIPVDIEEHDSRHLKIRVRHDEADLNQVWLNYQISADEKEQLIRLLLDVHRHDDYRGLTDVFHALPVLERYARQGKPGLFNPDYLQLTLPRLTKKGSEACNVAAIFVGRNLKYSRMLTKELRYIQDSPDEVLDKTALAYIFREPRLKNQQLSSHQVFSFIDSNDDQHKAIFRALNFSTGKITGPPGTGKSQVAVNIIANLIVRGQTVLFTSRNHKALHAIAERSSALLENKGMELLQYCSLPDGTACDPWFKRDPSTILGRAAITLSQPQLKAWYELLEEADRYWNELVPPLEQRFKQSAELGKVQHAVEQKEKALMKLLGNGISEMPKVSFFKELKRYSQHLREKPSGKGIVSDFKRFLWTIIYGKKHSNAFVRLEQMIPSRVKKHLTISLIRTEMERIIAAFDEYSRCVNNREKICGDCREDSNLQLVEEELHQRTSQLQRGLPDALAYFMAMTADAMKSDDMQDHIKALMSSMKRSDSLYLSHGLSSTLHDSDCLSFRHYLNLAPAWATTLLSMTKASPCLPAVFDKVVIDEASQCDVASIIPALFRAKGVVMLGDPKQFPPVISLKKDRNDYLINKYAVNDIACSIFDYTESTAYNTLNEPAVLLSHHYRCHPEIAEFFNESFYGNQLSVFTDAKRLLAPYGMKPGVDWVDVRNDVSAEMDAVEQRVKELVKAQYQGSVGVITPTRKLADELDERLNRYRHCFDGELIVNTVNAFQGGEKDVIIFMLGITDSLRSGHKWYISASDHYYIYNVAASRAKACLVLVGDREKCRQMNHPIISRLAALPFEQKSLSEKPIFDSVWEERLFRAFAENGINAQPQYHLVGRRLDFAIITESVKLDVEVDGVRWHTDVYGGRKIDDVWRDLQVMAAGWQVQRFWVYELERDMAACVKRIKDVLSEQG